MDPRAPGGVAALRASALRAAAVAALALVGLGAMLQALLDWPGVVLGVAVAAFALGAGMVVQGVPAHRPHQRFGAANAVTLARVGLTALLAGLVFAGPAPQVAIAAVVMAIVALSLDGVDGWFARTRGTASAFGARFDMETDAAFMLVLCVLAWRFGKAGPWILTAGLLRYAFVAAAYVLPWLRRPLPPAMRRKAVCVAQLIALIAMLAPFVPPALAAVLGALSLAALAVSFAIDVRWLYRERP